MHTQHMNMLEVYTNVQLNNNSELSADVIKLFDLLITELQFLRNKLHTIETREDR